MTNPTASSPGMDAAEAVLAATEWAELLSEQPERPVFRIHRRDVEYLLSFWRRAPELAEDASIARQALEDAQHEIDVERGERKLAEALMARAREDLARTEKDRDDWRNAALDRLKDVNALSSALMRPDGSRSPVSGEEPSEPNYDPSGYLPMPDPAKILRGPIVIREPAPAHPVAREEPSAVKDGHEA